jgi:hypothetical protein
VDASFTARAAAGLTFQGGLSTGSTLYDSCDIRAQVPELTLAAPFNVGVTTPYCHNVTPYLVQVKGLGTYRVPKIDVQVSAGIQSTPGPVVAANFNATNAFTQPSLGRVLSGNASNVSVNLIEPNQVFGDRLNQVDMRVSKILKFGGRYKANVGADLFNMFNRSPVIAQNNAFSPTTTTWQQPQSIIPGRLIKFSLVFDF